MTKKYSYFYAAVLTLFLVLFLLLCKYFRVSTDDYLYLAEIEKTSVYKIVYISYFHWSGRYATFTIQNLIFSFLYNRIPYFFLFPLLSFLILAFGIYKNIQLLAFYTHFGVSLLIRWMLSLSFMALLFFLSFDIGETWFWCSGMSCYLFSIIAVTWGMFFILHPATHLFCYLAMSSCFLFVGGSCEVYAPVFLILLAGILYNAYKRSFSFSAVLKYQLYKKLFIASIVLAIGYLLFLIAPGNFCRNQLFPPHRFFFSFFITAKSLVKFLILFLPAHLHYIFAFCSVFFLFGSDFKTNSNFKFKLGFAAFVKKATFFFVLFLLFYFYMIAYIMSETGPARIWFLVTVLFSVYCCSISFYAGYHHLISSTYIPVLKKGSIAIALLILSFSIIQQYGIAHRYATAYDEREQLLTGLNQWVKSDTIIRVAPLPPPGMLYGAEITDDTSHHTNQHLRSWYKLRFHAIKN